MKKWEHWTIFCPGRWAMDYFLQHWETFQRDWKKWQVYSWGCRPRAATSPRLGVTTCCSPAGPAGPTPDLGSLCRYRELVVTFICCVQVSRRLWWPVWTNKLGRLQTKRCVLAAVVLHSCWRPVAWIPVPQGRHNFKWPQTLLPFSLETHTASSMPFSDCRGLHPLPAIIILTRKYKAAVRPKGKLQTVCVFQSFK